MEVLDRIKSDANAALKAGEKERVSALRMMIADLQQEEKSGGDDAVGVLQRARKRRIEAAEAYREAGRDDLAEGEESEARIIEEYLPQQLGDAELEAIVGDAVSELGASSPKEMGQVMAAVMPRVQGRADGKRVSRLVQEKLTP